LRNALASLLKVQRRVVAALLSVCSETGDEHGDVALGQIFHG